MFSNETDNYNMLYGAYRKLKSYYHYNKNFLFMREKIALFEFDAASMDAILGKLAKVLKAPSKYSKEIDQWVNSIDYYVLPKSFSEEKKIENRFVTSSLPSKSITKVNYFIDMPIELHLIETVWTLFVAKIASDNKTINECSYGNAIDEKVLFDASDDDLKKSIRFEKNKLFKIYFPQYCAWKNDAIKSIERNKKSNSMVLVSLDIKGFFYSVRWTFEKLARIIPDIRLKDLEGITKIIKLIYEKYTNLISSASC